MAIIDAVPPYILMIVQIILISLIFIVGIFLCKECSISNIEKQLKEDRFLRREDVEKLIAPLLEQKQNGSKNIPKRVLSTVSSAVNKPKMLSIKNVPKKGIFMLNRKYYVLDSWTDDTVYLYDIKAGVVKSFSNDICNKKVKYFNIIVTNDFRTHK